jgi:hypothetical protein
MLKVIALAASVVLLTAPTASASEVIEKCGEKITWKGVWCALNHGDAKSHCIKAERYEKRIKHAEVDGNLNLVQYYRNLAAFEAAECKRLLELHAVEYSKK